MAKANKPRLESWIGRLLCSVGIHDFDILEVSFTFGDTDHIEKLQCKRCGLRVTRRAKSD